MNLSTYFMGNFGAKCLCIEQGHIHFKETISLLRIYHIYWSLYAWCRTHGVLHFIFLILITINYWNEKLIKDGKAFQSKTNRPLTNRCMGYIVNKLQQVWRWGRAGARDEGPKVNKVELVLGVGGPHVG